MPLIGRNNPIMAWILFLELLWFHKLEKRKKKKKYIAVGSDGNACNSDGGDGNS